MAEVVHYERHGVVGVVTVDNPPVNALSAEVRAGLRTLAEQGQGFRDFKGARA